MKQKKKDLCGCWDKTNKTLQKTVGFAKSQDWNFITFILRARRNSLKSYSYPLPLMWKQVLADLHNGAIKE